MSINANTKKKLQKTNKIVDIPSIIVSYMV